MVAQYILDIWQNLLWSQDLMEYGTMKFCKKSNQIYISVLAKSKVITVDSLAYGEFSTLFSYSDIDSISSID